MSDRLFEVGAAGEQLGELARLEADLDAVEVALRRLDDGSYGTCEECGEPIGDLETDPLSARCSAHRLRG